MPQKPKVESPADEQEKDAPDEMVEDQNSRGYYYDDAHGYQTYKPDDDDDDDGNTDIKS